MRDILSQGEEREPNPWPPRLASAAVLAVLLIVALVHYLPGLGHARPKPPRAAASPSQAPPAGPAQSLPLPPGQPDGIIGQASLRDGTLQLPVAGEQPAWFWPATGRTERIGGLPRERSGYQFTRIGSGWALQPGSDRLAELRRLCGAASAGLLSRRPGAVRDPGRNGGPGRPRRRPGRSVADQLPGGIRHENYGRARLRK